MSNNTGQGAGNPTSKRQRTTSRNPVGKARTRARTASADRWHNFPEIPIEPRIALILLWISLAAVLVSIAQPLFAGLLDAGSFVLYFVALVLAVLLMIQMHHRRRWARTLMVVLTVPGCILQAIVLLSAPFPADQPLVSLEQLPLFVAGTVAPAAALVLLLRSQAKRWFVAAPTTGRPDRRGGTV